MERRMRFLHPGLCLRSEVIEEQGLTITEAAALLKVTRTALSNVCNGKADISVEMSLRIAKVFGGTAEIWQRVQMSYNIHIATPKIEKLKLKPYIPSEEKKKRRKLASSVS
ncbi:HigA family addiction module antitoxin [Chitinophaga sp. SYP-B3965]|uniref:HigA family addiction module antitoxin n=1 Tax=Chitinophaga sp. SYP-B3965 TaxID=2663120 RepID=UPI001C129A88|nr:HigA family addiction module antitoxin [Chitinophaga sp. SYP-B3965]